MHDAGPHAPYEPPHAGGPHAGSSHPGGSHPGPGPFRRQPSEAELRKARLYIQWTGVLLVGALLATTLFLPWKLLAVALGLAAVVVGTITLVKMIRCGLPVALRVATVFGIVAAFMLTLLSGAQVLTWPFTQAYEQCMGRALTETAKEECLLDYQESLLRFPENLER